MIEGATYVICGSKDELDFAFAVQVVLLGYTNEFKRVDQWENGTQYKTGAGEICGFSQVSAREGERVLVLEVAENTDSSVERLLESRFDYYVKRRDVSVKKYPAMTCPTCNYRLSRDVVLKWLDAKHAKMYCTNCGNEVVLPPGPALLKTMPATRGMAPADLMTLQAGRHRCPRPCSCTEAEPGDSVLCELRLGECSPPELGREPLDQGLEGRGTRHHPRPTAKLANGREDLRYPRLHYQGRLRHRRRHTTLQDKI